MREARLSTFWAINFTKNVQYLTHFTLIASLYSTITIIYLSSLMTVSLKHRKSTPLQSSPTEVLLDSDEQETLIQSFIQSYQSQTNFLSISSNIITTIILLINIYYLPPNPSNLLSTLLPYAIIVLTPIRNNLPSYFPNFQKLILILTVTILLNHLLKTSLQTFRTPSNLIISTILPISTAGYAIMGDRMLEGTKSDIEELKKERYKFKKL
jgi:hypothetical protein